MWLPSAVPADGVVRSRRRSAPVAASHARGVTCDRRPSPERRRARIRRRVLGRTRDQAKQERAVLVLHDVTKTYPNGKLALRDVDLVIPEGDFVFLVGPSGAGKSTLIKLLIRDELATRGEVVLDGQDLARLGRRQVPKMRRKIGIIFQDFKLLPIEDGLRERRVRARGHRHAAQADPAGGRSRAGPRRADRPGEADPVPAVGRRAAADGDRPRARPRPAPDHRRRADRQPRPAHQLGDPPAAAADQRARRHGA